MTLVLVADAGPVPTLWARLRVAGMDEARKVLADRESTSCEHIGYSEHGGARSSGIGAEEIAGWSERKGIDGAVWTALGPKWNDQDGARPTQDEIISFLRDRGPDSAAAEYVRCAPRQVATRFRPAIEGALPWLRTV